MAEERTVIEAVEAFLTDRRRRGRAEGTLELYRRVCDDWQAWRRSRHLSARLCDVRKDDFQLFLDYLAHEHTPHQNNPHRPPANRRGHARHSVDGYRRVLRAFWNFAGDQEDDDGGSWLSGPQLRLFRRVICEPPAQDAARKPAITRAQLHELVAACGDGTNEESARNRAILLLLWESGMRVREICDLIEGQLDEADRSALVRGKGRDGGKDGWIFWGPHTGSAVLRYRLLRRGTRTSGPLFRGCSSRNNGKAITPNLVRAMLKTVAAKAGLALPHGCPCHWIRRGFAQHCRRHGASIEEVALLLRHEDVETTRLYLGADKEPRQAVHRRVFGATKEAARALYPPAEEAE